MKFHQLFSTFGSISTTRMPIFQPRHASVFATRQAPFSALSAPSSHAFAPYAGLLRRRTKANTAYTSRIIATLIVQANIQIAATYRLAYHAAAL